MAEDKKRKTAEEQYEALVQKIEGRLSWCKSSRDRKQFENRCRDVQNFWLGRQWDGIRSFRIPGRTEEEKKLHANPVDNYFKAFVEGIVGDITDRPVDIQIRPRSSEDEDVARTLSAIAQYLWYINRGDRKLEFAVRRAVMYGPLVAKVFWDPDWRASTWDPYPGNARFVNVLPTSIFIDPRIKATEEGVIQQAEFVIYGVRRSLAYIKERYPERGHEVKGDTYASYVTTLTRDDVEEYGYYDDDIEVLLIEYWYRGKPLAPEFPRRGEGEPPVEEREGWVHKAVVAGGILLEHRTYVYPWYPFVLEWIYPSDESIYGYGDAYDILIPQLVINKLNELSIEGAAIQSYGNWVTEEGNIRNKALFQKYAGMGNSLLPVVDVKRTVRVPGGNVPQSLFAHYRQALQAMEAVCGRYDVAQGRTPRNIQAASAIALLLQQAGGRVRQRARAVASFVEQLVRMMLDLVGMYYTEERMVRVLGEDNKPVMISVSRDQIVKKREFENPLTGEKTVLEYIPDYDVIVTAGSETPTSKAFYSDLALKLFQLNVIDEVALLDTLQFPRWREILARKQGLIPSPVQQMTQQEAPQGVEGASPPELQAVEQAAEVEANPFAQIGGAAPEEAETPEGEAARLEALMARLREAGLA
ncbi:MAG: hypothetical protein AB7V08_14690 [Elusimicrobiales bacterium]